MPAEGPGGAAELPPLPGGALEAPTDDEPDRVRLRDDPPPAPPDERQRQPGRVPGDGLQTGQGRPAILAATERPGSTRARDPRPAIHRRRTQGRRLIMPDAHPQDLTISRGGPPSAPGPRHARSKSEDAAESLGGVLRDRGAGGVCLRPGNGAGATLFEMASGRYRDSRKEGGTRR